jgi:hypothetical protein
MGYPGDVINYTPGVESGFVTILPEVTASLVAFVEVLGVISIDDAHEGSEILFLCFD